MTTALKQKVSRLERELGELRQAVSRSGSGSIGHPRTHGTDSHVPRQNHDASAAPTADDDSTLGYGPGSLWVDTTNDNVYICLDGADGAAVWTADLEAVALHAATHAHDGTDTTLAQVLGALALIFGSADTSGIRVDLESGDLAIREGDDSAYAKVRALQYIVGAATTSGILLKVLAGQLAVREGDDSALAPIAALTFTASGGGSDKLVDLTGGWIEVEEISAPGTPAGNKLRLYAKNHGSNSRLFYKGDAGVEEGPLDGEHVVRFVIEDPTDAEDIGVCFFFRAVTVTEVQAVVVGSSTPSVTINPKHSTDRSAAGNALLSSATAITGTTTGQNLTSFNDATIPADSHLWLETTAQSGTVDSLEITVRFTYD